MPIEHFAMRLQEVRCKAPVGEVPPPTPHLSPLAFINLLGTRLRGYIAHCSSDRRLHRRKPRHTLANRSDRGHTMPKITPHEALIYIMITMSAADRQISDRELERIAEIVRHLPVFMGYDINNLAKTAQGCGDVLGEEDGLEQLLEMVSDSLPKKLHETAYALAVEVA